MLRINIEMMILEEGFEVLVTIKIANKNKTVIKDLIKSLQAANAIAETSAGLIVSASECIDLI